MPPLDSPDVSDHTDAKSFIRRLQKKYGLVPSSTVHGTGGGRHEPNISSGSSSDDDDAGYEALDVPGTHPTAPAAHTAPHADRFQLLRAQPGGYFQSQSPHLGEGNSTFRRSPDVQLGQRLHEMEQQSAARCAAAEAEVAALRTLTEQLRKETEVLRAGEIAYPSCECSAVGVH